MGKSSEEHLTFMALRRGSHLQDWKERLHGLPTRVLLSFTLWLVFFIRHSIQYVDYGCTITSGEIYRYDEAFCPAPLNLMRTSRTSYQSFGEFARSIDNGLLD